jgi:hypothetical protein
MCVPEENADGISADGATAISMSIASPTANPGVGAGGSMSSPEKSIATSACSRIQSIAFIRANTTLQRSYMHDRDEKKPHNFGMSMECAWRKPRFYGEVLTVAERPWRRSRGEHQGMDVARVSTVGAVNSMLQDATGAVPSAAMTSSVVR